MSESDNRKGTSITLEGLTQRFAGKTVLDRIDLRLEPGQVLALLGPSGCGKTTLLKLLAGLMPVSPGDGKIIFGDQLVAGEGRFIPPESRGLGMVFQDYALWPHMTVGKNVSFSLEMRGIHKEERKVRVERALERVGLAGYADRQPSSLSGGQQQRVALARAIVAEPQVLLFDEPLSNLDRELRESLCHEIGALLRTMGTTAVYVTHDQEEAFALADIVAVMHGGRIRQLAQPHELVSSPASTLVADFLKLGNVIHHEAIPRQWQLKAQSLTRLGSEAHLFIPQSAMQLGGSGETVKASITSQRYRNGRYQTHVSTGYGCKGLVLSTDKRFERGDLVNLSLDWESLRWLPHIS